MSWRKRPSISRAGLIAIERSLRKSRSGKKTRRGERERPRTQLEIVPQEVHRGSAAAHCGEALPHRRAVFKPNHVEAEPRRKLSTRSRPVSQRLTALWGGKAAF